MVVDFTLSLFHGTQSWYLIVNAGTLSEQVFTTLFTKSLNDITELDFFCKGLS